MKIPIFPGKYHQNGGFLWAMLVSGRVSLSCDFVVPIKGDLKEAKCFVSYNCDKAFRVDGRNFTMVQGMGI